MNSPADNSLPSITAGYLHQIRKKMILMGGLLAGGAVLAVYAVALGSYGLSFEKLMAALIGKAEGPAAVVKLGQGPTSRFHTPYWLLGKTAQ